MTNDESSCSNMGCGLILVIGGLYYLYTTFPIMMTIITAIIIALIVYYFIRKNEAERKEEERKNYSLKMFREYPLFFKAYYYQHVSKKSFKAADIANDLANLNNIFGHIDDSMAKKWNEDLIEVQKLDSADHIYLQSLISGMNLLSSNRFKRLGDKLIFALPFDAVEKLTSKSVEQWLDEKKENELYEAFKQKYIQFLPSFLACHPELKSKKHIMEAEQMLLDFIEKNKQKIAYNSWKQNQSIFTQKTSALAGSIFQGSHRLLRNVVIKGVGDNEDYVDESISVAQIALQEYSDVATEEQSKADLDNHEWVKNLSLCKASYNTSILNNLVKFIKSTPKDKEHESIVVIVKENFLGWDKETVQYHYQQITNLLDEFDICDVSNFREKIQQPNYKNAYVIDLISDEEQVSNICEQMMSPYVENMPNVVYVSLARELTDEEIDERIEVERQRRKKLLRYDTIVDSMENGFTIWSVMNPHSDKEDVVNSEEDIQKLELGISDDDMLPYCSYYKALGMRIGGLIEKWTENGAESFFAPINDISKLRVGGWQRDMSLAAEMGNGSTYRTIYICGLSPEIKEEIQRQDEEPFSSTPKLGSMLREILSALKLPLDYPWIILRGNSKTLCIIVKSGDKDDMSIETSLGLVNAKHIEQKQRLFASDEDSAPFAYMIVQWNGTQVLPPSQYRKGEKRCQFLNIGIPSTEPIEVSLTQIDELMYSFCSKIEYKSFVYNDRVLYLAVPKKIKEVNLNSIERIVTFSDSNSWVEKSDSAGANIVKGIKYALGLDGYTVNPTKALHHLNLANKGIASYNIASLIAAGVLPGRKSSVNLYLTLATASTTHKWSYVNVIKNNAKFTFRQDSLDAS
jgi:hypothetical protein